MLGFHLFLGPVLLAYPGPRQGPAADPAAHLIRLWLRIPSALLRKENSLGAFTLVIQESHFGDRLPSPRLNVATRRAEISWSAWCNKY